MYPGFACLNEIGCRRGNEDSLYFAVACPEDGRDGKRVFLRPRTAVCAAVCDGMGGLADGSVASGTVVRAVDSWFSGALSAGVPSPGKVAEGWREMIRAVNDSLMRAGNERGKRTGTTCAALFLTARRYLTMNIGDSRIYRIRDRRCVPLTRDQTLGEREVRAGRMTPGEARESGADTVLLQCVGANPRVEPVFRSGSVRRGDCFLICSDGFRRRISDEEIAEVIRRAGGREDGRALDLALRELAAAALSRGERDNMTAVAVRAEVL